MTALETTPLSGLTFRGVLRSEFIKLVTLRSTVWCFGIVVVVTIGLGLLLAATVGSPVDLPEEAQQGTWVQVATLGINFSQLVVAILGVLIITGEYSTGMIRSTLTSVPRRLPALAAKAIVIGGATFVVSLVAIVAAAILPAGLLANNGITPDFGDSGVWLALVGGAGYLALLAVISLALGAIVRNSAGGIAASIGVILVLPTVLTVFAVVTGAEWVQNVMQFLPASAGTVLFTYQTSAAAMAEGIALEPWQALLVLAAWAAVLYAIAAALLKRRDA